MNGKVISFMNMKGGVGKTTLCVNLAYCLSKEFNSKILIIDMDPQANATQYLLDQKTFMELINNKKTIYEIYEDFLEIYSTVYGDIRNEIDISPEKLIYKFSEKLHILPGNLALVKISQGVDAKVVLKLKEYIESYNLKEKYDFIFIDCPPTHSIYTSSALEATDYYILPVKPDYLSSIGIDLFKSIINKHNRTSPKKVKCIGIVFTLVQNYQYYRDVMDRIRDQNIFSTFENYMQHSSTIPKAAESNQFLYDIQGQKSNIIELTKEFLDKINELQ